MSKEFVINNLKKAFSSINLGKKEERLLYQDVKLALSPGKAYGLVGPNGVGKSTFLKHISGIFRKNDDFPLVKTAGILTSNPGYFDALTIKRNFKLLCTLNRVNKPQAELDKVLNSFVEEYEIKDDQFVMTLSTGMRAYLGLLAVLQVEADLYIFDEATNGLDKDKVKFFEDAIKDLKKRNKIVIVVSHTHEILERVADEYLTFGEKTISTKPALEE